MEEKSIHVHNLTKLFDGRRVVDDLSFSVKKGEVFALLGHNGAGKSTTIDLILGLKKPEKGSARILGMDAAGNRKKVYHPWMASEKGGCPNHPMPENRTHHTGKQADSYRNESPFEKKCHIFSQRSILFSVPHLMSPLIICRKYSWILPASDDIPPLLSDPRFYSYARCRRPPR